MKNIMVRAWEIARKGQEQFGGKVSEYLSESLKMAWAEAKAPKKALLTTTAGSRKHKSWVAKIEGTHPKWKLDRKFVNAVDENLSEKHFELEDGIYDVCDAGERDFIQVIDGEINYIGYGDVMESVA